MSTSSPPPPVDPAPVPYYSSSSSDGNDSDTEERGSSTTSASLSRARPEESIDGGSQFSRSRGDPNHRSIRLGHQTGRHGPNVEAGSTEYTTVRLRARPSKCTY